MGQKVHPTGFRLGISTEYSSKWYAGNKDYSSYLLEDYRIREYLKKELENASVSKIVIERPTKEAIVNIYTSRPGIVIGKKERILKSSEIRLHRYSKQIKRL